MFQWLLGWLEYRNKNNIFAIIILKYVYESRLKKHNFKQLQKQAYQWNSYILINKGFHTNSSVSIAYFY